MTHPDRATGVSRPTRRPPPPTLGPTMDTTHVAGRRTLPPVPRPARERSTDAAPTAAAPPLEPPGHRPDTAQRFVVRLRAAAADFAAAAGAESAVVPEAVPPARHRRARCRVVLRFGDGTEADVTFLGPAGEPGNPSRHGFDRQIVRWLGAGQLRDAAWEVRDPDAPDGLAVDLTAWVAADRNR